jgi:hypothetical protein
MARPDTVGLHAELLDAIKSMLAKGWSVPVV